MEQLVRFGEYYAASRLYQAHGSAEVVVYRCSFEETLFHAFPLACLVIEALQDDRKVLHQEDTAKDGYQQFLVNNDGVYCDDSSNGQTARIAHEYLGRIGIVPQEADKCTDKGTDKDYQFFRAGNVHDIQVAGIFDVARYVGEYSQGQSDNGRVPCRHSVHSVIQVGSVADGGNYENRDNHKQYPTCCLGMFTHEAH